MKIKIFSKQYTDDLEDEMNDFLGSVDDVNVLNMNISADGHDLFIGWIQYKDPYKPQ